MNKSTHKVEVVPVKLEPHPNADSLSIVRVYGYSVVVRSDDWRGIECGAYIVPDSVVPDTELFKFVGESRRIRVRRFRGVLSQGLLVPAPAGSRVGDDVAEQLGVTRYEPPESSVMGGDAESPPPGFNPVYDLESWHRYRDLLVPGENVIVTEKLHGANSRYVFAEGRFYCGSHRSWKKADPSSLWWKVADRNPWIEETCRLFPGSCLYGEIYGAVQDLRYGAKGGEAWFRVFDMLSCGGEWVHPRGIMRLFKEENRVPVVYDGPYDPERILSLSVGRSTIADNLREGVVIEPTLTRTDPEIGRVKLKCVSSEYLERGK